MCWPMSDVYVYQLVQCRMLASHTLQYLNNNQRKLNAVKFPFKSFLCRYTLHIFLFSVFNVCVCVEVRIRRGDISKTFFFFHVISGCPEFKTK